MLSFITGRSKSDEKESRLQETQYVVIDTELTGLNGRRDSIVSIGAVRMKGGRIDIGESFYKMINPKTSLTAESVVIHEIMPSDVVMKPNIDAVLGGFLDYCGADILVGFCVSVDMEFLNRETKRLFGAPLENQVIDIYPLFEWLLKKGIFSGEKAALLSSRYQLYDIARCFDIEVNGAHNAIIDAFITAQIFQRFIPMLSRAGMKSAADLVKLTKNFKGGDHSRISSNMSNF
ncbi:MAG TPA: 3'-5' exonuclease [Candidatus Sulfobium mesophilum]|nr:3'-5' exonuclease [Candidatus Sulfobium mesophilum]